MIAADLDVTHTRRNRSVGAVVARELLDTLSTTALALVGRHRRSRSAFAARVEHVSQQHHHTYPPAQGQVRGVLSR